MRELALHFRVERNFKRSRENSVGEGNMRSVQTEAEFLKPELVHRPPFVRKKLVSQREATAHFSLRTFLSLLIEFPSHSHSTRHPQKCGRGADQSGITVPTMPTRGTVKSLRNLGISDFSVADRFYSILSISVQWYIIEIINDSKIKLLSLLST